MAYLINQIIANSASLIVFGIFLMPFIIGIVYSIYQNKQYMKTEYFAATKTPYNKIRRDRGLSGEYLTYKELTRLAGNKKFLFNCYLPKDDGTTSEMDLILLHSSGIYVLESKNYSGWIFGTETKRLWTQTFRNGGKEKFYNPTMQNGTHIKWLMHSLPDIDKEIFYSIIVFSERCELKDITLTTNQHMIVKRNYLLQAFAKTIENNVLSDDAIESIYQKLYPFTQVSEAVRLAHIEQIRA